MNTRRIATGAQTASCYFRTSVEHPYRKALIQVTERCNLGCAHCFVSAGRYGDMMSPAQIRDRLIPQLAAARVTRVTLTGGEPFVHPDLLEITRAFRDAGMGVGVCTNATLTTDEQITELAAMGVHANVSLDGFAAASHGRFRGDRNSFSTTVETVRRFAAAGILQGLLCTPNSLAEDQEYARLCEFARQQGARYVLMNPPSTCAASTRSPSRSPPTWTSSTSGSPTTAGRWPGAKPGRSSTCSPPVRSPPAPTWSSRPALPSRGTPTASSSSGTSGSTTTSPPAWTATGSMTGTGSVTTPPAGHAICRRTAGRAARPPSWRRIGDLDAEVCPVVPQGRALLPVTPV